MGTISADCFTQQDLDELCLFIVEGQSTRNFFLEKRPDQSRGNFYVWLDKYGTKEQQDQYTRAQELRQEAVFEDCLEIADHTGNDTKIKRSRGGDEYEEPNHEWITRSKLRVDTRLKMLERMNPKKYGVQSNVKLSNDPDAPFIPADPVNVYLPDNGRTLTAPAPTKAKAKPKRKK
jgi:hypothetical protein